MQGELLDRIFLAVKIATAIISGVLFAWSWTLIKYVEWPFHLLAVYAVILMAYWCAIDLGLFHFVYKRFGLEGWYKSLGTLFGAFALAYLPFLVWDAAVFCVVVLGRNVFGSCLKAAFNLPQDFNFLRWLLIFMLFGLISALHMFLKNYFEMQHEKTQFSAAGNGNGSVSEILTTSSSGKTHVIKVEEIIRIEANRYYARLVLAESEHLVRESMESLTKKLEPRGFLRVHRSHIVNTAFLDSIERNDSACSVRLSNGCSVPVSRSHAARLQEKLPGRIN